ncbi:(2Fe-2S)-binding protein [Methylomarinum sp. Ch1-1]|uniref:(2Fe-2S)-binding protein n=1 Tax=Methylomarinum roseum TaxID=3067653 RepID=A0AAU7NS59_9GAMM|nr:(2Fe-2S)-binding protein [Methylomarinum sp. Ch1-1]MDP4520167.1 (2Fe-2S)-binding protein [Methylomarinum sp. Ch1-1]
MNDMSPDQEQNVICYCSGTTEEKIKTLIDEGVDNLDRLSRITGACSGCGGCEYNVMELLAEYGETHS